MSITPSLLITSTTKVARYICSFQTKRMKSFTEKFKGTNFRAMGIVIHCATTTKQKMYQTIKNIPPNAINHGKEVGGVKFLTGFPKALYILIHMNI